MVRYHAYTLPGRCRLVYCCARKHARTHTANPAQELLCITLPGLVSPRSLLGGSSSM